MTNNISEINIIDRINAVLKIVKSIKVIDLLDENVDFPKLAWYVGQSNDSYDYLHLYDCKLNDLNKVGHSWSGWIIPSDIETLEDAEEYIDNSKKIYNPSRWTMNLYASANERYAYALNSFEEAKNFAEVLNYVGKYWKLVDYTIKEANERCRALRLAREMFVQLSVLEKPKTIVDQLREYLANSSEEQIEKDWKELEKWNEIGPTVDEYLRELPMLEIDADKFKELIEAHVDNKDVMSKIHDHALICRTYRLCRKYPNAAKQYFDALPKATLDTTED